MEQESTEETAEATETPAEEATSVQDSGVADLVADKQRRAAETLKNLLNSRPAKQKQETNQSDLMALAKKDPIAFLQQMGYNTDGLQVNNSVESMLAQVKEEVGGLKQVFSKKLSEDEAYRQEVQKKEAREAVRSFIDSSNKYSFVQAAGAHDAVFEHIYNHLNTTGEVLSEAEAAEYVNGRLKSLYEKLARHQGTTKSSDAPGEVKQATTLTNRDAASGSAPPTKLSLLSNEEAIQEMISRIKRS